MTFRMFMLLILTAPLLAGPRIRVVTYNIHFGGGVTAPRVPEIHIWNPFGRDPVIGGQSLRLSRGTGPLEGIATALAGLGPDVVLLNEVLNSCAQSMGIDQAKYLAEHTGWNLQYFENAHRGWFGLLNSGGNAILSRHRLSDQGGRILDADDNRGVTTARVWLPQVPGGVMVAGTHLSTSPAGGRRAAQIAGIVDHLKGEQSPIVVAGDFNEKPGGADVRCLYDAFDALGRPLSGAFETAPQGPGESFPASGPRARIDYLFATRPLTPRACFVARDVMHSDHLPVVADYEVTPDEPVPAAPTAPLALLGVR